MSSRRVKPILRWFQSPPAGGAENMAADRTLLALPGLWLRIYRWCRPTVSLGWFQQPDDPPDRPPGLPVVRRPTGGGAILHDRELTVALAVPAAFLPARVAASYAVLHDAVADVLAGFGLRVVQAPPGRSCRAAGRQAWCFAEAAAPDLVLPGAGKVFGSAQRRRAGRVLHHGSLVLHPPARPSHAAGLGVDLPAAAFGEALARALGRRLGCGVARVPPSQALGVRRAPAAPGGPRCSRSLRPAGGPPFEVRGAGGR